jgi:uncharacterized FAD-dependent dehydrogenase
MDFLLGGGLVAPVQRVTDFLDGVDGSKSQTANDEDGLGPVRSSYRLGVKEGPLHELYPSFVTEALRKALLEFDKQMPGFVCKGIPVLRSSCLLAFHSCRCSWRL